MLATPLSYNNLLLVGTKVIVPVLTVYNACGLTNYFTEVMSAAANHDS
jgi:hypothetical protein